MKDIFKQHKATNHSDTQNFWMAELGLKTTSDHRFTVDWAGEDDDFEIYIFDQAQTANERIIYTLHANDEASAKLLRDAMEIEVGYWDVEDYYSGPNPHQEAKQDYQRTEMAAIKGGL